MSARVCCRGGGTSIDFFSPKVNGTEVPTGTEAGGMNRKGRDAFSFRLVCASPKAKTMMALRNGR